MPLNKDEDHIKELTFFILYTFTILAFFALLLWIISSVTNSWMYFNILSENTGLSIVYLKRVHYALVALTALLWTYNSYKHTHVKRKKRSVTKHELIDHHTLHVLKLIVIPFVALLLLLFAGFAALLQTYGPATFEMRVTFPNDPTVFEFFSLVESVLLALLALTAHLYLLKRFMYWVKNG